MQPSRWDLLRAEWDGKITSLDAAIDKECGLCFPFFNQWELHQPVHQVPWTCGLQGCLGFLKCSLLLKKNSSRAKNSNLYSGYFFHKSPTGFIKSLRICLSGYQTIGQLQSQKCYFIEAGDNPPEQFLLQNITNSTRHGQTAMRIPA